jgi:hypothetical protein
MIMAGTPCPYKGKIGTDAMTAWKDNSGDIPSGSQLMDSKKKLNEERMNDDWTQENEN